ncbi:transposase [Nocardia nova]|uniref:transposase n=1 Tax=Nocardia nova TaxID=37330 RepID=UPI0009ED4B86|nr:transposase [Nocardia nova]
MYRAGHGVGRSRGGLTTKAHVTTDGNAPRPGRADHAWPSRGPGAMLPAMLEQVAVPRLAGGPPRRNPDPVIADKAYSAASNRDLLRRKRIRSVIPQRSDQVANRKKRGRLDGRPPGFDKVEYTRRNVVERAFDTAEHWRAVATRYDKLALTYRAGFTRALIVERLTSSGDTTSSRCPAAT